MNNNEYEIFYPDYFVSILYSPKNFELKEIKFEKNDSEINFYKID